MRRRAFVLALAAALILPGLASAHARLVKSEPAKRATLAKAPASVRLWFSEAVEPKFAKLEVVDGSGKSVAKGAPELSPDDAKLLAIGLEPLSAGSYTVTFEVLSVDGHRVKQSFRFTVKAAPAAP